MTSLDTRHRLSPMPAQSLNDFDQHSFRSHESRSQTPFDFICIEDGRVYTSSYLDSGSRVPRYIESRGDWRRSTPNLPQLHVPDDRRAPIQLQSTAHKTSSKRGMDVLVKACANDRLLGRRSRSPSMNNEEPIALSTYPSGKAPPSGAEGGADNVVWPIEREDFPAPPYYYAMTRSKEAKTTDDGENGIDADELDSDELAEREQEAERLRREQAELEKAANGIGRVFLKNLHEREQWRGVAAKQSRFDPRNRARDPSGRRPPKQPPMYTGPAAPFASPSRLEDRPRIWEDWELERYALFDKYGQASSTTAASTLPHYLSAASASYPHSSTTPKSATLPQVGRAGSPLTLDDWQKLRVTDDLDDSESGVAHRSGAASPTYLAPIVKSTIAEPFYRQDFFEPHDTPDCGRAGAFEVSRTKYKLDELVTTNRRLPEDVDRRHLERHLTLEDFVAVFDMSPQEFYSMPEWKRSDVKKAAKLY